MKFFKKQAVMATSCTISHSHNFLAAHADTSLSCSYKFAKLAHLLKQSFMLLKQRVVNKPSVSIRNSSVMNWAPLIKASTSLEINNCKNHNYPLQGKTILCVGGKIKLYPEYDQIVKNSGGNFVSFHGDSNDTLDNLFQLMEKIADMIICPVDCVNHEAFQTIKYYCRFSGKPCVLLDRSAVNSFSMGIRMLTIMMTEKSYRIGH
ncbi:hypothetical protein C7H79_07735 [Nitrosomonas supralitoralis]|uniref:DUF2325 domain-containing protein n=2 Tax=Nitrosomonas supralitoralis TaxID=2116706 RepID=A0A2P7NVK4_9PROT|nr:hypothetical protein C7H79_07735 [Nitrosomonas supralitoralis]